MLVLLLLLAVAPETSASAPSSQPAFAPASRPIASAVLSGELREAGTRKRIAAAAVAIAVGDFTAQTNSDGKGRFRFIELPTGQATLSAAESAHLAQKTELVLEAHSETRVVLYLKRARIDPFETIVTTKRDQTEVQKYTLQHDELVVLPGSYGDPLRAIQNLPGIARSPFGLGLLVIRGADPSDSEYLIDGVHMDYLYHFAALTSVISEKMIGDVSYLPGNMGARYGRATAGVIEVHSAPVEPETWHVKASVDLAQATLYAEIPVGDKTEIVVAGRRSYIDAVLPAVLPQLVSNAPTLLPVYYDYQLRLGQKTAHFGDFTLFFYGANDQLVFAQTANKNTGTFNPTSFHYESGFVSLQPRWLWKMSANTTNDLTVLGTYELLHVNTPQANYNQIDWQLGIRDDLGVKLGPTVTLHVGIDGFADQLDFSALLPIDLPFPLFPSPLSRNPPLAQSSANGLSYDIAGYGEFELRFGNWRVVPGLRVSVLGTSVDPIGSVQPRLNARYELTKALQLKAGVGFYQKYPGAQGLVPGQGNQNLGAQNALQSSFGGEWQMMPAISLDVVGFYNYVWDQVSPSNTVLVENGQTVPLLWANNQQGRIYGAELLLRSKPYKGFFGWVAYTLSRSERINPTINDWHLFDFDQTHVLTILASYKLPFDFQLGARFRLTSGNPVTPVLRALFDSDAGGHTPVYGPYNSARLPLFQQLDLRLDRRFTFDKWQLSLYVDVQNVYNYKNVEFYQYSADYRTLGYIYGLPILPVLGIEGQY